MYMQSWASCSSFLRRSVTSSLVHPGLLSTFSRRYHRTATHTGGYSSTVDRVTVPCGSNGHIVVKYGYSTTPVRYVYEPVIETRDGLRPPIILYLPPGPVLRASSSLSSLDIARDLATRTLATVVEINYRLDGHNRYPTPVHDVLFGYDWIIQHLIPQRALTRPGRSSSHAVRMGVFGELVGGSLASMLALTECHPNGPHIAAAAINEPIVDWVFPEFIASVVDPNELKPRRKRARKRAHSFQIYGQGSAIGSSDLIELRRSAFRKHEHYFDPFASPTLFFRTAGANVPPGGFDETMDEFEELSRIEQEDFHRQQMRLGALSNIGSQQDDESALGQTTTPRRTSRRYPGTGSGLQLPAFHVTCGSDSPLLDQSAELAALIRRSKMREAEAIRYEADREHAIYQAEEEDDLDIESRSALWCNGERSLTTVVDWFKRHL